MQLPQSWGSARATLVIAGTTAALWLIVAILGLDDHAALWGGFIPARLSGRIEDVVLAPVFLTPLTATLVHSGLVHLAFNLVVLLFCGRSPPSASTALKFARFRTIIPPPELDPQIMAANGSPPSGRRRVRIFDERHRDGDGR